MKWAVVPIINIGWSKIRFTVVSMQNYSESQFVCHAKYLCHTTQPVMVLQRTEPTEQGFIQSHLIVLHTYTSSWYSYHKDALKIFFK